MVDLIMNLIECVNSYFQNIMESIKSYSKKITKYLDKKRELNYLDYKTATTIFELAKLILFPVFVLTIPYIIFEDLCKYFNLKFITN